MAQAADSEPRTAAHGAFVAKRRPLLSPAPCPSRAADGRPRVPTCRGRPSIITYAVPRPLSARSRARQRRCLAPFTWTDRTGPRQWHGSGLLHTLCGSENVRFGIQACLHVPCQRVHAMHVAPNLFLNQFDP